MPALRGLLIELALMVAVGVALAALGPFDSFRLGSFANRLAYWLPAALLGYAIFRPLSWLSERAAERLNLPRTATLLAAVLVAAIPGTIAIAMLGGYRLDALPRFAPMFELYVNVALIGALVMLMFVQLERRSGPAPVQSAPADPLAEAAPAAPFLDRLPASWGGRLLALEMEDHYVRAHGPDGQSLLILMRMRDAEAELAGIEGLRVHRSWWVARDAVMARSRDGRSLRLQLDGGIEAPVARERAAALRRAGWLD